VRVFNSSPETKRVIPFSIQCCANILHEPRVGILSPFSKFSSNMAAFLSFTRFHWKPASCTRCRRSWLYARFAHATCACQFLLFLSCIYDMPGPLQDLPISWMPSIRETISLMDGTFSQWVIRRTVLIYKAEYHRVVTRLVVLSRKHPSPPAFSSAYDL